MGIAWNATELCITYRNFAKLTHILNDVPKCKRIFLNPWNIFIHTENECISTNRGSDMFWACDTWCNNKIYSYFVDLVNINFIVLNTVHQDKRSVGLSLIFFRSLQNNDSCIKMKYYTLACFFMVFNANNRYSSCCIRDIRSVPTTV